MTFLLVLAAIYFGFRLLFRYVLPGILARKMTEMQENMQAQQRDFQDQHNPKEEGETEIITPRDSESSIDDRPSYDDGDYIEFEEVD